MNDGYKGYVDLKWEYGGIQRNMWVYGGICGCLLGTFGYMWMYDGYMGVFVDVQWVYIDL